MKEGWISLFKWLNRFLLELLKPLHLSSSTHTQLSVGIQAILIILFAFLIAYLLRVVINKSIIRLTSKSKYKHFLRTLIFNKGVLKITQIVGFSILASTFPIILKSYSTLK